MLAERISNRNHSFLGWCITKIADYSQLIKLRLSTLVIFSTAVSYLYAAKGRSFSWSHFLTLVIGEFLVTGAAGAFNQILERKTDKMMTRTQSRPLPAGRMSLLEAGIAGLLIALSGLSLLFFCVNYLTAFWGLVSLLSYTFIYTPLKKITRISVFLGALPGAMSPLLGYIAYTNEFNLEAGLLFLIQFIWQFPHFWSIAWTLHDEYKHAGFTFLPYKERNKQSAFVIFFSTFILIPASALPFFFHFVGKTYLGVALIASCFFTWQAFRLYEKQDLKCALQLMFGSFLYLPLVQIILFFDKQ